MKNLKKYQRKVVHDVFAKYKGSALLALDMGLGKTVIALACLSHIHRPAIVVCPASLKWNWVSEIKKFYPEMKYYICKGRNPVDIGEKVDCYICNYEILYDWQNFFIKKKIDVLIADESHFVKEKNSKRTKSAIRISSFCKNKILLTGTPIENKPIELWSQLAIIDKNMFPSWLLFAKRYNGATRDIWGWKMTRATNCAELHSILEEKCMIRIKKEEVLKELPPIVRQVIPIEIENKKEYSEAEKDIISWIRKHNTTDLNIEKTKKAEAQVKIDKLKLIAAKGKLSQVVEWVNSNSRNEKIVVFCYHREILFSLHEMLDNHVFVCSETSSEERQKCVEVFQSDPNCRVFLTTIRVGGTGFTLVSSSTTVFIQLDWNSSKHRQAEARVHRIGQIASSVNAIYFVAKDTVEEKIMKLIDTKDIDVSSVIDGREIDSSLLLTEVLKSMIGEKNEQ